MTERTAQLRKLSEAVEPSPVTVMITDKEGTIEYVNPRFSEVTGYSAKEAIGQNPRILKSGNQPKIIAIKEDKKCLKRKEKS